MDTVDDRLSVSIVIVNYNGWTYLRDCLGALGASDASGAECIVVDNASTDGSVENVRENFPRVKIVRLERNHGFARANNMGAEAARGKFLVFLNNDTVVTPDWLSPLLEAMTAEKGVGAAGSKLLLHGMPGKVNSAGADITINGSGYDIGFMDDDSEKYNVQGPKGAVCAAAMMVRREEFLSIGGFDPVYFMYFEDVDLCWRYWLFGYRVLYVPWSVVLHRFGSSTGTDLRSPFRVFYGTRNTLFNTLKNYETRNLLRALCLNLVVHAVTFFIHLISLRGLSAFAICRAYGSVIRHLPAVMRARKDIQSKRTVSDKWLFENSLVVSLKAAFRENLRLRRVIRQCLRSP
jgi:GT2 family glycosyltransferase